MSERTVTVLKAYAHRTPEEGLCAMEAVAYLAGEGHSDHPLCACSAIGAYVRMLNDRMPDDETRTRLLLPIVPLLVGSRSRTSTVIRRAYVAIDVAVREIAPMALDAEKLEGHAATLRALAPLAGAEAGRQAVPVVWRVVEACRGSGALTGCLERAYEATFAAAGGRQPQSAKERPGAGSLYRSPELAVARAAASLEKALQVAGAREALREAMLAAAVRCVRAMAEVTE